ncbi:hypothetical protein SBOR_1619 [Sclerotinia borealis F-4128]|uniref:Mg2+ transporter protein, CorA-like/Zinc transport protein ZntB n=1 Tax=Sclerotinia borealis (strain F-4128) TaxID=1432307 RepID=W9CQ89_SCLBF|nr:hypothetical protein SBOR_1619 [Sclerotinia borealis F-4128]
MDDYMFTTNVARCRNVYENTTYLEMVSYSDPSLNSIEEHPLTPDEFENFLNRRGVFAPPKIPEGVIQLACIRLILQLNAKHPDTFAPNVLSFSSAAYISMVKTMNLPYRSIESGSAVEIVNRKSDVRKKGLTRGWELTLSHDVNHAITTGYAKGTESSDMVESIQHLKACILQIGHPMLLPAIIFSHDISFKTDLKQRDARDWLRRLEHAVSMRSEIEEKEGYVREGVIDLDAINRDLVECHSQVLWKRPKAYLQILQQLEKAMKMLDERLPEERKDETMRALQASMLARFDFYRVKLQAIESYAFTTLQRLDIQRSAVRSPISLIPAKLTKKNQLYNIIAQKESKLNFQMAKEQRQLAHAAKRDSSTMKTISLLSAIFFPGVYLASVFSMTFFNFQNDGTPAVSKSFWLYWAVTIPCTMIIVGWWYVWEKKRERRYSLEDIDLERGSDDMEKEIMATMRKRTMSKASTWDKKHPPTANGGHGHVHGIAEKLVGKKTE